MPFKLLIAGINTASIQFLSANSSTSSSDISGVTTVVDSTNKLAEAISKYGAYAVILAIFIVTFVAMFLYIQSSNRKMMNQIMSEKTKASESNDITDQKILDAILRIVDNKTGPQSVVQQIEDKDRKPDNVIDSYEKNKNTLVHAYVDINLAFKDAARIALMKLQCDRVAIYVFHNGNSSIHGFPFFKMSCIYEWSTHGVTQRGKTHNDMPLHVYTSIIDELYNNDEFVVSNVQARSESDKCISFFTEGARINSIYFKAIRDNDNELAGFAVSEFKDINDFSNKDLKDRTDTIMKDFVDSIRSIVVHQSVRENCEDD